MSGGNRPVIPAESAAAAASSRAWRSAAPSARVMATGRPRGAARPQSGPGGRGSARRFEVPGAREGSAAPQPSEALGWLYSARAHPSSASPISRPPWLAAPGAPAPDPGAAWRGACGGRRVPGPAPAAPPPPAPSGPPGAWRCRAGWQRPPGAGGKRGSGMAWSPRDWGRESGREGKPCGDFRKTLACSNGFLMGRSAGRYRRPTRPGLLAFAWSPVPSGFAN